MCVYFFPRMRRRLEHFSESIANNATEWKDFFNAMEPEFACLPTSFQDADDISRLIFLKCLRPDRVAPALEAC